MRQRKTPARNGTSGRSIVVEKENVLMFDLKESTEGFCRRKRKVIPRRGAKDRKGVRTDRGVWYEQSGG